MPMPRKRVTLKCEYCNKRFEVKASFASSYRFCSMNCRSQSGREKIICEQCGKEIEIQKSRKAKYCSLSCSTTARNLTDQNPSYYRDICGDKNPMHGKGFFGEDNPMFGKTGNQSPAWNGGRKVRNDGYIFVYVPDHPFAISSGRDRRRVYVLEHRIVMEQHLHRYLDPSEVVHHIDGDNTNNVIDNLRLYSSQSEHISHGHS